MLVATLSKLLCMAIKYDVQLLSLYPQGVMCFPGLSQSA